MDYKIIKVTSYGGIDTLVDDECLLNWLQSKVKKKIKKGWKPVDGPRVGKRVAYQAMIRDKPNEKYLKSLSEDVDSQIKGLKSGLKESDQTAKELTDE